MLNEKEFYQYVEANILNYLPEMEGKKVMVQRVKRNNQISMMGLSIGETKNYLVPVLYLEIFYRNYLRGQELSDTMKASISENEFIVRFGGEEFLIIMKNPTESSARELATKINQEFAKLVLTEEELLEGGIEL